MNYKIVAIIVGVLITAYAVLTFSLMQENESVENNAGMLGNGKDVSTVITSSAEYHDGVQGYLARPDQSGEFPGIVMIHEWWGLNDNIRDMARQMASEGYVVLAVDLYEGQVAEDPSQARELSSSVRSNPNEAIENMKSAVDFLRNHEAVDNDNIGSLGWCFGGGMSLQLALNEELSATGIYYGSLVTNEEELSSIEWPVLGVFGDQDQSIPVDQVREFESTLDELDIENEIYVYEGVGHAFANPSGTNYAPEETGDAWEKTVMFFDKHLKRM